MESTTAWVPVNQEQQQIVKDYDNLGLIELKLIQKEIESIIKIKELFEDKYKAMYGRYNLTLEEQRNHHRNNYSKMEQYHFKLDAEVKDKIKETEEEQKKIQLKLDKLVAKRNQLGDDNEEDEFVDEIDDDEELEEIKPKAKKLGRPKKTATRKK